jgi:hypothetical protein
VTQHFRPARLMLTRLSLGAGPPKRASDRVELASRMLCALVLVLALPVALTVGTVVHADVADRGHAEAATRHEEVAVLLDDAASAGRRDTGSLTVATPGRWYALDGSAHEGMVGAPRDAADGDEVTIWLDADGDQTDRPLQTFDVLTAGLFVGVLVFLVLALAAAAGHLGVCHVLGRHRARQWEREWRSVEPLWAGRRGAREAASPLLDSRVAGVALGRKAQQDGCRPWTRITSRPAAT